MKKIVHIHTDKKFISHTLKRYKCSEFNNSIIIFGDKSQYKSYSEKTLFFGYNLSGIREALHYCSNADLVVVYDLNTIKSILVNRLPSKVEIAWRFFGYELYSSKAKLYYSELTKECLRPSALENVSSIATYHLRKVKTFLKWRTDTNKEFLQAIDRINFFLGLYDKEYNYLKELWPNLPVFVQIPSEKPVDCSYKVTNIKDACVLLGNNRSAYNNHLDLLKIISKKSVAEDIRFSLLFSYGMNNKYAQKVRSKARSLNNVGLQEEFKPFKNFKKMYASNSALVINGYRQMAVGNIFLALANGLKLYLNKKNTLFDYLKEKKFHINSIQHFSEDIQTGNIGLKKKLRIYNYDCLQELYNDRTIEDLQHEIKELIS